MRRPISLAARLTVLFGIAAAVVFPLFGWIVSQSVEQHLAEGDANELDVIASAVERALSMLESRDNSGRAQQRFDDILVGHHSASLYLVGPEGETLFSSGAHPDLSQIAQTMSLEGAGNSVYRWDDGEHSYRVLARNVSPSESLPSEAQVLVVAVPLDYHFEFLASFRRTLWFMIATSIGVMSLIGWVAVRQGHAPLRDIVTRMRQITASELNTRVPPDRVPHELSDLAESFNGMLERVDEAFQRLSNFNADIAHELRTPIMNLMTQTQVALSRSRTIEAYREVLYSNMEEYERMSRMVSDMLFLSQADKSNYVIECDEVDIGKEVRKLSEYYEGWADERGVSLTLEGSGLIVGDRLMLQRALGNLLSNAIRHTPSGGAVQIIVDAKGDGNVHISVQNPGPKIASEHLSRIFDRFYRVDPSRQRSGEGAGLGLAIVKSIVAAHGGEIEVRSTETATTFEIRLPCDFRTNEHQALSARSDQ